MNCFSLLTLSCSVGIWPASDLWTLSTAKTKKRIVMLLSVITKWHLCQITMTLATTLEAPVLYSLFGFNIFIAWSEELTEWWSSWRVKNCLLRWNHTWILQWNNRVWMYSLESKHESHFPWMGAFERKCLEYFFSKMNHLHPTSGSAQTSADGAAALTERLCQVQAKYN